MTSTKPAWRDAPEWARCLAMDSNGDWFWWEVYPFPVNDPEPKRAIPVPRWCSPIGDDHHTGNRRKLAARGDDEYHKDWHKTREERQR